MKILFVMLAPPVPANAGHRIRNHTLLQALAAEGHRVSVVSYAPPAEAAAPPPELGALCTDFQLISEPEGSRSWGRLQALGSRRPYGAIRLQSEEMQAAVARRLADEFDVIICDDIYLLANLPGRQEPTRRAPSQPSGIPVLLNKHDLTYRIVGQFARAERNWAKKLYGWLEGWKIRRLEVASCSSTDAVMTCSDWDRELLERDCPAAKFFVVPNVVDVGDYRPASGDDGRTVLFVGAMEWLPNQDAVDFFVADILPRLRELAPDMRFVVAGRNPPSAMLQRYADLADVSFTGTVPDLRPLIAEAAVCVIPLRIGSGTRLKILEAGAMGKAIVSTALGAEGLAFRHGQEIFLADHPESFAQSVGLLIGQPELRIALGRAARARVEEFFSLAVLQARLAEALAFCCNHKTHARGPLAHCCAAGDQS